MFPSFAVNDGLGFGFEKLRVLFDFFGDGEVESTSVPSSESEILRFDGPVPVLSSFSASAFLAGAFLLCDGFVADFAPGVFVDADLGLDLGAGLGLVACFAAGGLRVGLATGSSLSFSCSLALIRPLRLVSSAGAAAFTAFAFGFAAPFGSPVAFRSGAMLKLVCGFGNCCHDSMIEKRKWDKAAFSR